MSEQTAFDAKLTDVVLKEGGTGVYYLQGKIWGDRQKRWKDGTIIYTSYLPGWKHGDILSAGSVVKTKNTRYLIESVRRSVH
jgi:hypothetical protein